MMERIENARVHGVAVNVFLNPDLEFYWYIQWISAKVAWRAIQRINPDWDRREREVTLVLGMLNTASELFVWLHTAPRHPRRDWRGWQEHREAYRAVKYAREWMYTDVVEKYPDFVELFGHYLEQAELRFDDAGIEL